MPDKKQIMLRAIALAEKAINPSPNPRVGAIVLQNGKIVGQGFHEKTGKPHAEILALRQAGKRARGGELFVNLEPCNHFGRTPPCSQAILKAGIKKVFIGMLDTTAAGGGAKFLRANGVEIETGIMEKECRELNKIWLKNVEEKMPWVTLKMVLDENGSTIPQPGRKWISSKKSRLEVMKMRRQFDAIAVGVGTILADDPQLTVRGLKIEKQPTRIIFDPDHRTPKSAKVSKNSGKTILITKKEFPEFDLNKILQKLFQSGIDSIFLEGGLTTAQYFLKAKLVNEVFIFQKGNLTENKTWQDLRLKKIGEFSGDGLFHQSV